MQHLHTTQFHNEEASTPGIGWRAGLICLASVLVIAIAVNSLLLA